MMRRSVLAAVVLLVVSGPASGLANADHTTVEAATGSDRAPASARAIPDFNGDGYADLAVRGDHYPDHVNLPHWVVSVIYGSARGLTAARNQAWTQAPISPMRHDLCVWSATRQLATSTATATPIWLSASTPPTPN